jgi:cell division transport system permease protein
VSPSAYFSRQAQTLVGSLGRLAVHPVASLLTMGVIAIALALPLCLEVLLQNATTLTANWNEAFALSVYLDKPTGATRAEAIAREIQARGDVAAVRLVTAAQALAEFRDSSGFGAALDALADNPLPNTLIVTPSPSASSPAGMAALKTAIGAIANVAIVQLDTEWVQRLVAILDLLRGVVRLTGGLLAAGVILIIGNTIRLDIQNRRDEIEVMKLVGATDGFARRPFLWTGVWYGFGGGVAAVVLVGIAVAVLSGPADRLAGLYGSAFRLRFLDARTTCATVLVSALLGWAGSWLAATHHIRAINPR